MVDSTTHVASRGPAVVGRPGARTVAWLAAGGATAAAAYRLARRSMDLHGKVVLITGGSRGLGLLIARELVDHGCRLAICARDQEELEGARSELATLGAAVLVVRRGGSLGAALKARAARRRMRVREVLPLGAGARLIEVEHDGRRLLLGVTTAQVALLESRPCEPGEQA